MTSKWEENMIKINFNLLRFFNCSSRLKIWDSNSAVFVYVVLQTSALLSLAQGCQLSTFRNLENSYCYHLSHHRCDKWNWGFMSILSPPMGSGEKPQNILLFYWFKYLEMAKICCLKLFFCRKFNLYHHKVFVILDQRSKTHRDTW